jgi:hypothetical protein
VVRKKRKVVMAIVPARKRELGFGCPYVVSAVAEVGGTSTLEVSMRLRFLLAAVLASFALTLFAPAGPAAADVDVDCIEELVLDPAMCDEAR